MSGDRQVSLLFSGGVDSTAAAITLARRFDAIHLLTFGNGYGHLQIERSRGRADELRTRLPGRISHEVRSVRPLFEKLLAQPAQDLDRFGSGFVWCLACKIAMHTEAILYNLAHGVATIADGSSGATAEMVEQMPSSLRRIRGFYGEHGIGYESPVYAVRREQSIDLLEREGFRMGLRVRDRFLGVQPLCPPGLLYYLPFLALGQPPLHDEAVVEAFFDEKLAIARAHIAERCNQEGWARSVSPTTPPIPPVPEVALPSAAPIGPARYLGGAALVAGAHAAQLAALATASLVRPHYRRVLPLHVEFTKRTLAGILRRERIEVHRAAPDGDGEAEGSP